MHAQGEFAVAVCYRVLGFCPAAAAVQDVVLQPCRKAAGVAHEVEDLRVGRRGVKLLRVGVLRDGTVAHDDDAVGQLQRFFAVVGDENAGEAQFALQGFQPETQVVPHLHVQRAEGFVKEDDFRLGGERPRQRDALLLATGELCRVAPAHVGKLYHVEQLRDFFADARFCRSLAARLDGEAEGDVVGDGEVFEECVVLEDEADVAFAHRHVGNVAAIEADLPAVGAFQPGDEAQQGGFAAAGGAEQRRHFAVFDGEVGGLQRGVVAVGFVQLSDLDAHGGSLLTPSPAGRSPPRGRGGVVLWRYACSFRATQVFSARVARAMRTSSTALANAAAAW